MKSDSTLPRAGFYFFGQTNTPRVRSVNGRDLSLPPVGFGYFRTISPNREWHLTTSFAAGASGQFNYLGANVGMQYRFYTKPIFDGAIKPYLGLGGTLSLARSRFADPGSQTLMNAAGGTLSGGIYPGFKVKLGEKVFFDVSVPVELPLYSLVSQSLGGQRMIQSSLLPSTTPRVGVRLGVGFNLFK